MNTAPSDVTREGFGPGTEHERPHLGLADSQTVGTWGPPPSQVRAASGPSAGAAPGILLVSGSNDSRESYFYFIGA